MEAVQVVQANVATHTAAVAKFEALKSFLPLATMPQLAYGVFRAQGVGLPQVAFPGITLSGSTFDGFAPNDRVASDGLDLFFPLDPSGQITALPIAEHGIKVKEIAEELVRRSQMVLIAQDYFDAKQVLYHLHVAELGVRVAQETVSVLQNRLAERQVYPVEVQQAQTDEGKARLNLASLQRDQRRTQRELGSVMYRSRLLIPQSTGPLPIQAQTSFDFDLADAEPVNLDLVSIFPTSREEAIDLAKRLRFEVRMLVEGVTIARLQEQRSKLRLFGLGSLPLGLANREYGGITSLGLVFGSYYEVPAFDVGLWANVRRAKLDVVRSELDLEKMLIDVAVDAGNSWDKWQLANQNWQQKQTELKLVSQEYDRQVQRFQGQQAIMLDVLGAQLNVLQADANLWTAWYNLQLARLDVLRATELLLDYVEHVVPPEPIRECSRNIQAAKVSRS
jgi:outer membrane protein TolC